MLKAKDYRQRAWGALSGKWGIMAITYLLIAVVSGLCSGLNFIGVGAGVTFIGVGTILLFILNGPIAFGWAVQAQNVVRGRPVDIKDILAGKNRFADSLIAYFIINVYTFLWALLFIIPGIIAGYSYSMTYFVLADHPNMTADQARRESMRIMTGNKWRLFCLHLSFFGWILLCVLTLGILVFWVAPYLQCANAEFYESIKQTTNEQKAYEKAVDPFDNSGETNAKAQSDKSDQKPAEPFYVFEEERPREKDNTDSDISDYKKE